MNQSDAVDTISRLIPQMEGTTPDEVITKYARDKDLSPAQVERLGHVFNTASTLSMMEKDKSAAPYVLDVPKMVRGYYDQSSRAAKLASIFDEDPQEKAASTSGQKLFEELPSVWVEQKKVEKEAKAPEPATRLTPKEYLRQALPVADQLMKIAVDKALDWRAELGKIQKEAKANDFDQEQLGLLYNDLRQQLGEDTARDISGKFATFLVGDGQLELPTLPDLFIERDRTGLRDKLASAWEDHLQAEEARDTFFASLPEIEKCAHECDDFETRQSLNQFAEALDRLGKFAGWVGKEAGAAPVAAGPWAGSSESARQAEEYWRTVEEEERKEDPRMSELVPAALAGTFQGGQAAAESTAKLLLHDLPGYAGELMPDGQLGKSLDRSIGNKNRQKLRDHQLDLARIESDTRSMAHLQELIMRDDILSTKPFDAVFEAYKSIRRAAPEVAEDRSLLKLMLRQAVETQGLDIDSASAARKFEFPARGPSRATWGTSQSTEEDRNTRT